MTLANPFSFHTGYSVKDKTTGKGNPIFETDCPFCQKADHFHFFGNVNEEKPWAWGCKVCGLKGNLYTFLQLFVEKCCNNDIGPAAKNRSLPERACRDLKYNKINQTFILPTYKVGKINNIYKCSDTFKLLGTPSISGTLYNWDEVSEQEVWICEGQWDRMAGLAIAPTDEPRTFTAIPGANSFKESWCGAYRDKDVVICADNDDAGKSCVDKIVKTFEESPLRPRSLRVVQWPETCPVGYDLRDYYIEFGKKGWRPLIDKYVKVIENRSAVKLTNTPIIEDFSCDSYDKALDSFETAFHTTADMRAALASVMASIYSIKVPGEQLWIKIIGPPGCGKTRIAKAVSGSDSVVSKSTFTGLFSGWSDNDDSDAGLIPQIASRTLIVKDADALLRQPNVEQIMSELRDFYDKDSSVQYKNRRMFDYRDVKSTIVICGTQVLRRADQSFLGERFLSLEMDVNPADQEAMCRKVMKRSKDVMKGNYKDPEQQIMSSMKGWINHLKDRELDSTIPPEFEEVIFRLSSLTSLMRTTIDRDFKGRLQSPAVPEIPTRLIGQMLTATYSLSAVFGQNVPNQEVFSIVCKLLKDTMNPRSNRFKLCDIILENPGIDAYDLMEVSGLQKTTLQEELDDLHVLGFVQLKAVPSTSPGRRRMGFTLDPKIATPFMDLV